jgi:hypothetical protein
LIEYKRPSKIAPGIRSPASPDGTTLVGNPQGDYRLGAVRQFPLRQLSHNSMRFATQCELIESIFLLRLLYPDAVLHAE